MKPANKPIAWSVEQDAVLRRKWVAGEKMEAIAASFGRTRSAIRHRLTMLGFSLKRNTAERHVWTTHEVDELRELWIDLTLTSAQIGDRLGVSASAVKAQASRLALPRRQPVMAGWGKPKAIMLIEDECRPPLDTGLVSKLVALGGFPALSERLVSSRGGRSVYACVLPLVWPTLDRVAA